jgi:organic hydroperoxide reductase OsmC/OhrA
MPIAEINGVTPPASLTSWRQAPRVLVPVRQSQATVEIQKQDGGFAITRIRLETEAKVPGIDEAGFREQAQTAKANCPVSKALAGTTIELDARRV